MIDDKACSGAATGVSSHVEGKAMRVFLRVAFCCCLAAGVAMAQRGGGRVGGGGFRGGGSMGGGSIGGGSIGGGFGHGGFGGGGFRGGGTVFRGGHGGFGGFRGGNFGRFGFRGFYGRNYWPFLSYPSFGFGYSYWPGFYDYGYNSYPGYSYPEYQPASNVTVVYPQQA